MTKLIHASLVLTSCFVFTPIAVDDAAAQDRNWERRDRDDDRERGRRGLGGDDDDRVRRGRDDDDDRGRRRSMRDDDDDARSRRGRGDDRDRPWGGRDRWWGDYDRGRNCYTVRRRFIDRDGDVVIRRSRVCED